jgi:hypothetical protein
MSDYIVPGLIAYCICSLFFTGFILALFKGASDDHDNTAGAAEGAFPADRFEGR